MLNVQLKTLNILGKCMHPFMSIPKCTNCKQFDECYALLEKSKKGKVVAPLDKTPMLKKEAWKDVSFRGKKGQAFLMKLQSKKQS